MFQLQAGFMYVVSHHRREHTCRIWWKKNEELHLGILQFLYCSVAALRYKCSSMCVCLADQAVCSILPLYPWLKWQNFCSKQPQHCWDLKHATRQEKGSVLSSPCGFWLSLSSQDDYAVLIFFPHIFVRGMVEHPVEAQSRFAILVGDDLQTSAQNRLTATLNYDMGITNCYL